ncbi:MAG: hypothetical protein SFU21_14960, partial [Flavihumibacter sp.]|nr:hypothetical protein [Flavihumibacter sp.]
KWSKENYPLPELPRYVFSRYIRMRAKLITRIELPLLILKMAGICIVIKMGEECCQYCLFKLAVV